MKEKQKQFVELRSKSIPFSEIAKELKVSKPTLIEWSKEFQLDIANLRAIEIEAIQDRFYISRIKRLELFGTQIEKINKELDKRKLDDVSVEKLLEILLKYLTLVKQDESPVTFQSEKDLGDDMLLFGIKTWHP